MTPVTITVFLTLTVSTSANAVTHTQSIISFYLEDENTEDIYGEGHREVQPNLVLDIRKY